MTIAKNSQTSLPTLICHSAIVSLVLVACGGTSSQPTAAAAPNVKTQANSVDCSEAYGGKSARCYSIACPSLYDEFIGTWDGPFESYVRELSTSENVYRPFTNTVSYSASDCLQEAESKDSFIIGRRKDVYPTFRELAAKSEEGLLITGRHPDGTPFLRTVDDEGFNEYTRIAKEEGSDLSLWELAVSATSHPCPTSEQPEKVCQQPEMSFHLRDEQDPAAATTRNVSIVMTVGPESQPYWSGVIVKGHHTKVKP